MDRGCILHCTALSTQNRSERGRGESEGGGGATHSGSSSDPSLQSFSPSHGSPWYTHSPEIGHVNQPTRHPAYLQ
jgi:hypothetical protein